MSSRDLDSTFRTLPDPESLAEALLDAATTGNFERELALAQAAIEARRDELDPLELFCYRVLCFDVAQVSTTDPIVRHEVAVCLLHGAVEAGVPAWEAIRASSRLDEVERQAIEHASGSELLELIAYAPDEGMRGFAVSQIESAGMRALDSGIGEPGVRAAPACNWSQRRRVSSRICPQAAASARVASKTQWIPESRRCQHFG